MKSPEAILVQLVLYVLTVFIGFAIIWVIIYPGVYFIIMRENPYKLYTKVIPTMIVAFSSDSRFETKYKNY